MMDFLDRDLDDAELWAVIDSAAYSARTRKPLLALKNHSDSPRVARSSLIPSKPFRNPRPVHSTTPPSPQALEVEEVRAPADGEVVQGEHYWATLRPHKMARIAAETRTADDCRMVVVRNPNSRTPVVSVASASERSPEPGMMMVKEVRPMMIESPSSEDWPSADKENLTRHNLFGHFPSVSSFKEYQNAALSILDKSDYSMISGSPYIKKTGWRKISFFFNISYEIKDRSIEFDEKRDVQRAEFIVRAYMQGGRFSDGWGSCERREKRFFKANHDIPSTAETRAKNKACQDLLGIGAPTRIR